MQYDWSKNVYRLKPHPMFPKLAVKHPIGPSHVYLVQIFILRINRRWFCIIITRNYSMDTAFVSKTLSPLGNKRHAEATACVLSKTYSYVHKTRTSCTKRNGGSDVRSVTWSRASHHWELTYDHLLTKKLVQGNNGVRAVLAAR